MLDINYISMITYFKIKFCRNDIYSFFIFSNRELQYVDAVNATTGKEGWLTLNISEALNHWVNNPDGNRGLYLSVHLAERSSKRFNFSSSSFSCSLLSALV